VARRRPVLFIQGAGAGTHDEWGFRLVESLHDLHEVAVVISGAHTESR
jgi:hypothetical protein